MTRRGIITTLTSMAAAVMGNARAQSGERIAELSWGRYEPVTAEQQASHDKCLAKQAAAEKPLWVCLPPQPKRIPGSVRMALYLDEFDGIEIVQGKERIFVSRKEIWEALRETPPLSPTFTGGSEP